MGALDDLGVTVIGAGIAGLAAACALGQRGARVRVVERAPLLSEVGAGLQLSPNAMRVIDALGLGPSLDAVSLPCRAVDLRDCAGQRVALLDLGRFRPQARFRLVHRPALLKVLERGARAAGAMIVLGHPLDQPPADAALVVGADGVRGRMRGLLNGEETPFFTRQTAWRALIPAEDGAEPIAQIFLGPGRHLVSYPLAGGFRNIVAVVERPGWQDEDWSRPGDPAELRAAFAAFQGPVPGWLARVDEVGLWGLFRHEVAPVWQRGPGPGRPALVLIGDAAHPTLPFLAQGAAMAIEDAGVLAACLDAAPDIATGLARFQALRRPRCLRIVAAANANARNYHLRGPARAVAHAGLRAIARLAPGRLVDRFGWLYDHDPLAELA